MKFGTVVGRGAKKVKRQQRRPLRVEVLEERRLLSVVPSLVDDLTQPPGCNEVGGEICPLTAEGNSFQSELFTEAGGTDEILAVGENVFFRSRYLFEQNQLYSVGAYDVPTAPTQISSDGGFQPTAVGPNVYFYEEVAGDTTLWQSDGSAAAEVRDIDDNFSFDTQSAAVGGKLVFVNADAETGAELWSLDPAGDPPTGPFLDLRAGQDSSNPHFNGVAGDQLFFTAQTGSDNFGLWVTDSTGAGTEEIIADVGPVVGFDNFRQWNDETVFLEQIGDGNLVSDVVWATDGTAANTRRIDVPTLIDDGSAAGVADRSSLLVVDDDIYYPAKAAEADGFELWKISKKIWKPNGIEISQVTSETFQQSPANLTLVRSDLFFTASSGDSGNELWWLDLEVGGPAVLVDVNTAPGGGSDPFWLTPFDRNLVFVADDSTGSVGRELMAFNHPFDPATNIEQFDSILPGIESAFPRSLIDVGGHLFFTADDGTQGRELWVGIPDGPDIAVEINPFTPIAHLEGLIDFGSVGMGVTSEPQVLTIKNTGGEPLILFAPSPVQIQGTDPEQFDPVGPNERTLNPGDSTTFTLSFAPDAIGEFTAQVVLSHNDPNEYPYRFYVKGTGIDAPVFEGDISVRGQGQEIVTPDLVPDVADGTDYGDVLLGEVNVHTFSIINTGNDVLRLGDPDIQITINTNDTSGDPDLRARLDEAIAIWESVLQDPVSLTFDVIVGDTDPVAGWMVSTATWGEVPYDVVRDAIIADASPSERSLVTRLPLLSELQTVGGTATGTINISQANAKALGLDLESITWDVPADCFTDGCDGVFTVDDGTNFTDPGTTELVLHEVGHALGFISTLGSDQDDDDLSTLDMFRLEPGQGDIDFTNAPRVVGLGIDAVFYDGKYEQPEGLTTPAGLTVGDIPMSTGEDPAVGDGYQPSHFKHNGLNGGVVIGIMDPVMSYTTADDPITEADRSVLGLIGWNIGDPSPILVSVEGLNPGDFTVTSQPALAVLNPGEAANFDIEFDPLAVGQRVAAVTIHSDDPDEEPYFFAIVGVGQAPDPAPNIRVLGNGLALENGDMEPEVPDGTAFINALPGQQVAHSFTIENTGDALLTFGDPDDEAPEALPITVAGENSEDFTIITQPLSSLEPGQSTTFEVQFQPTTFGARLATIFIASNDSDEGLFQFDVHGQVGLVDNYWTSQGPAAISEGLVHNIMPNNPVTGAIQTVVAHPINPNILYLGAVNGGIWKTIDATSPVFMWEPQTDNQSSLSIGAMAFDPSDETSNTLVAGIGRFSSFGDFGGERTGILVTADGGNTWTNPGSAGLEGANISGIAAHGDQVVVTSNLGGIYRSTDGGYGFQRIKSATDGDDPPPAGDDPPPGINIEDDLFFDLVHHFDSGTLYAGATGNESGIFQSDDFGETWTTISSGDIAGKLANAKANNVKLAVQQTTGRLYAAVLIGGKLIGVADPIEGGYLVEPGGVYYYEDGSWEPVGSQEYPFPILPLSPDLSQGKGILLNEFINRLDPANPIQENGDDEPGVRPSVNEDDEPECPIIITSYWHRLVTGDLVLVENELAMAGQANGLWQVEVIDEDSFALVGSSPFEGNECAPPINEETGEEEELVLAQPEFNQADAGTWFKMEDINPTPTDPTAMDAPPVPPHIPFSLAVDPSDPTLVYAGGEEQPAPFFWADFRTNRMGATESFGAARSTGLIVRGIADPPVEEGIADPPVEEERPGKLPLRWTTITHDLSPNPDLSLDPANWLPTSDQDPRHVLLDMPVNAIGTRSNTAPSPGSRDMTFDALGSLIEVDDGGIYKRTIPENQYGDWSSLVGNLQVSEVYSVAYDTNSDTIISAAQGMGTTYQYSSSAKQWVTLNRSAGGDVAVDTSSRVDEQESIRYSFGDPVEPDYPDPYSVFPPEPGDLVHCSSSVDLVEPNALVPGDLDTGDVKTHLQRTRWDQYGNLIKSEWVCSDNDSGSPPLKWQETITPIQLNNINPRRMVIGGANGLYESFDQGDNVELVLPHISATADNVGNPLDYGGRKDGIDNEEVVYVGTAGGSIWVRKEQYQIQTFVQTFPDAVGQEPIRDVIMNTEDFENAFAITDSAVFATSDMGVSWTDITGDLFQLFDSAEMNIDKLLSLEFMPGLNDDAIVVGTNIGTFASLLSNPNPRWFEMGADLPNVPVWDLDYDPVDDVLVVGTLGRGVWKMAGVGGDIGVSLNELKVNSLQGESPSTFKVALTLPEAVMYSNQYPGKQVITFDPSLDGQTLDLLDGSFVITDSVEIDGSALDSFTIRAGDLTVEDDQVGHGQIFTINNGDDQVAIEVAIRGLTLTGGDEDTEGGAISNRENLTLDNVTFTNNHATQIGGALSHRQGALTVTNSRFEGNSSSGGHGGAIAVWNANQDVLIQNTSFHDNLSMGDGGGLDFLGGSGQVVVDRVTLSDNEATDRGGGILAYRPITVISSTISGNSAGEEGGGIWTNDQMDIDHSTILQNQSLGAGGGIYAAASDQSVNISHTIVAQNTSLGSGVPDVGVAAGRTATALFSLIGDNTGSGFSVASVTGSSADGNFIGNPYVGGVIDPQLGPLEDNGGPTLTHLPLVTSPVVDAGDPGALSGMDGIPEFDQRGDGAFRVADGTDSGVRRIDMGAVELNLVLTGDFNGDDSVDAADYSIWRDTRSSTTELAADANGNGVVDEVDYKYWKQNFGATTVVAMSAVAANSALAQVTVNADVSMPLPAMTTTVAMAIIDEPAVAVITQEEPESLARPNDLAFALLGEQAAESGQGGVVLSSTGETSEPAASLLLLAVNQSRSSAAFDPDPWSIDQEAEDDQSTTALLSALAVEDLFGGIDG